MAQSTGVNINRLEGGLGRRSDNTDNYAALIVPMPLASLNLEAKTAVKLLQVEDAIAIGLDESFDANNKVLAYHHISEVFRLDPNATLFLIGLEKGAEGLLVKECIADILPTIRANKEIKGFAFAGFNDTLTTLETDIETIQIELAEALFAESRFVDFVLLEGKSPVKINPTNALDFRTKNAKQCSIVIAQDPFIASQDEAYKNYAAIGSALGMLSVRKVNENLGSVDIVNKPNFAKGQLDYPLTNSQKDLWLTSYLSDGTLTESLSKVDLKSLDTKGYIYTTSYEGYSGIYFNNSSTAILKTSDYAYIENNRVWNKAARIIRQTLIPRIKSNFQKDPLTGFIKDSTVAYWISLVNKALEQMQKDEEISGFDFYINPKQYVSDESPIKAKAQVVSNGIVHEFDIDLGLTNEIA